jgi:beta-barrel assembly-enhancing protease
VAIGKLTLVALTAVLAAAPAVAQKKPPPLPTYTAAYTPTGVDERGLWMESDEIERRLRDSRSVIKDPALTDFVREVLCRTVGQDRCASVRIYVQRIPAFNATMYPNGAMTVWSGLLLRVRSEAELGAVLGHEFAHFELRHGVKGFKNARSGTDLMAWAGILLPYSPSFQIGAIGQIFAFDRAQETEADLQGLRYLGPSDYPSAEAASVWERLMAETDASALGRKRKATQRYAAGFFASHPTVPARAAYLRKAAQEIGDTGPYPTDRYRETLANWLPEFLSDQIKLNDFGGSEYLLNELAVDGWTTPLLFARGELYRERGNPRDLVSAALFYQQAIDQGGAAPEAYRGLGLSLLRSQQPVPGRAALREYLHNRPEAPDAALISTLIAE